MVPAPIVRGALLRFERRAAGECGKGVAVSDF